jgi:hypothetical protein
MERRIFWLVVFVLGIIADFTLPIWWALGATIPIFHDRVVGRLPKRLVRVNYELCKLH